MAEYGTNVGNIFYEVTLDTRKLVEQTRVVDRVTGQAAASFSRITEAIKILAAAMALVKAAQLADDMRLLAARVQVAAGGIEAGAVALAELQRISARTQTSVADNAQVFQRLNASIRAMGGTQADTLRITELLGMAVKVSGASAQEASAAMTQFGQALGSGKLQGDELRSLLENAPYLMQQLADGIGVPVGALKQLGEEGKLTSDVVTTALSKAAGKITADFEKLPATLSGAFAVMLDNAKRANEQLDNLTGSSAALTGVTRGLGTVFDKLADQLLAANSQATGLSRNELVQKWADGTTRVFTYVIDAAEILVRAFRALGLGLAGLGAAGDAVKRGGFGQARVILGEMVDDIKQLANTDTAGARIRALLDAGAGGGRGFVNPGPAPSKLKAPPGAGGAKDKFDDAKYLAKLREDVATEQERIALVEEEALRQNAERRKKGEIDAKTAAEAELLIRQKALNDRLALGERLRQEIEASGKKEADAEARAAADRARGLELAQTSIAGTDPVQAVILQAERKSEALREAAARDLENAALYAQALVAVEQQANEQILEIVTKRNAEAAAQQSQLLQNYGALFGGMADLAKTFEGEQSGIYKAMFAVSKAFAIADSLIKIQQGIANALALPYPANIAAAASTAAAASSIVTTIRGTNFGGGRRFGGDVNAAGMYRVTEAGVPEVFSAGDGSQYLLPGSDGRVTPLDGAGAKVSVEVHNYTGAPVDVRQSPDGQTIEIAVGRAVAEVARNFTENSGPVWSAAKGSTNIQGRLG